MLPKGPWFFFLILLPMWVGAQETVPADSLDTDTLDALTAVRNEPDTVEYSAIDLQYDFPSRTFNLNDKALIRYRGATLNSDTIWFDQENEVLQAAGHPVLKDLQNPPLSGYRMKYNLKSRIGQVYYGSSYRDNQRFNGIEIRRLPDQRLQLARGDFSTCGGEGDSAHQHYYFYCRRMVVKPKENIVAAPVVLNIADVPVAILPILVSPLKSGRRSGLLTPKFGGDQAQGFYLRDIGYYWAINDYMDATVKGDLVEGSEARFEKTTSYAQFRYKKLYVLDGEVSGTAYLDELSLANSGWDIRFRHNQNLRPDGKSKLAGEGSFVSKSDLRQNSSLVDTTILSQTANANMTWIRSFYSGPSLTVKVSQEHNLTSDYVKRQLPDVNFSSSSPIFPKYSLTPDGWKYWLGKLNYSFSERANVLYQGSPDTVLNQDTSRTWIGNGLKLGLNGTYRALQVFNITPSINLKGDWSAYRFIDSLDSIPSQMAFTARGRSFWSGSAAINADTKLYGIWRPEWGRFVGLRHVLTPGISYTYAPRLDTNYAFVPHPLLGQTRYQALSKAVGFSLGNALDLKYKWKNTNAGSSDSSQNVRFLSTSHSTSYNFGADSLQWAPISSSVGLQLTPEYLFRVGLTHNFYHKYSDDPNQVRIPELTAWNYALSKNFTWKGQLTTGSYKESDSSKVAITMPWTFGFNYSYSFSSSRVGRTLFQDQISHSSSFSLAMNPTRDWNLAYSASYNFNEGRFASHQLDFKKDLHCWAMTFRWTPVGPAAGWYFSIYITELPDIKLQAGDTQTN